MMGLLDYLMLETRIDARVSDLQERLALVHRTSQARLADDLDSLQAEASALRQDVDELALFTRALSTLLVDKGVITHDELLERVVEVDREDGAEDGRMSSTPT